MRTRHRSGRGVGTSAASPFPPFVFGCDFSLSCRELTVDERLIRAVEEGVGDRDREGALCDLPEGPHPAYRLSQLVTGVRRSELVVNNNDVHASELVHGMVAKEIVRLLRDE